MNRNIDIKELSKFEFLQKLSKKELKQFSNLFNIRTFKAQEVIFKQGYPHVLIYLILQGKVLLSLTKPDGKSIELATLGQYEEFGEVGIFIEGSRSATAMPIVDTQLCAISQQDFMHFIADYPRIGVKVLYGLGKSLSKMLNERDKLMFANLSKICDLESELAQADKTSDEHGKN